MRPDLLYPELSYKIIGCSYEVFNEIGGGHKEKVYHKALAIAFRNAGLKFKEELYFPLRFQNEVVTKKFFDFLVEEKIVVEIKSTSRLIKKDFTQLLDYMVTSKIKLGLLICFGITEVKFKRVLNTDLLNQ